MRVLLFVLHVCMLREYDGARLTAMLVWGVDEVVVSAGHVGGTRGSGIVSSAADVLWISVVRGMRAVGGVCETGMCLAWDAVCGEYNQCLLIFSKCCRIKSKVSILRSHLFEMNGNHKHLEHSILLFSLLSYF